nr:hypothetical protein [Candidatus Burarchaeum sp.]
MKKLAEIVGAWLGILAISVLLMLAFIAGEGYTHEAGHLLVGGAVNVLLGKPLPHVSNWMSMGPIPIPQRVEGGPGWPWYMLLASAGPVFGVLFAYIVARYATKNFSMPEQIGTALVYLVLAYEFYSNFMCGTDNPTLNSLYPPACAQNYMLAGALIYVLGIFFLCLLAVAHAFKGRWMHSILRKLKKRPEEKEDFGYVPKEVVGKSEFHHRNGSVLQVVAIKPKEWGDLILINEHYQIVVVDWFKKALGKKAFEALCYHECAHLDCDAPSPAIPLFAAVCIFFLAGIVPALAAFVFLTVASNWSVETHCDLQAVKNVGRGFFLRAMKKAYGLRAKELQEEASEKGRLASFIHDLRSLTHPPYGVRRYFAANLAV